jgi:2-hydroxy-6-oxonona-2,4-dienedioate hydrolase
LRGLAQVPVADAPGEGRVVVVLVAELGIDAAPLLGCWVGATTALDMTLMHPERVERLIIGACHASTGGDPYLLGPFPSEVMRLYPEAHTEPVDPDRIRRLLLALVYDPALVTDELVEGMVQARAAHPDYFAAGKQSVSVAHSNVSALHEVHVPTLIVHGRFDRMVPLEQGLMILSYVREADLVVLNNCGHWPPFERPDEYSSHVLRFLREASVGG